MNELTGGWTQSGVGCSIKGRESAGDCGLGRHRKGEFTSEKGGADRRSKKIKKIY
jgi:hypothetical protein